MDCHLAAFAWHGRRALTNRLLVVPAGLALAAAFPSTSAADHTAAQGHTLALLPRATGAGVNSVRTLPDRGPVGDGPRALRRVEEDAAEDLHDWLDVPWHERESPEAERLLEDEGTAPLTDHARRLQRLRSVELNDDPGPERSATRGSGSASPDPTSGRRRPRWAWLLPRLVLDARLVVAAGRTEAITLASAQFSGPAADAERAAQPQPTPVARSSAVVEPPACLGEVHRRAVVQAALEPERARSFLRRAARAGWLPELRLRFERRVGRREALDIPLDALPTDPLALSTANEARYEARVVWDLGRLVFTPEELHAQATAMRMADARRELLAAVDHLFFTRRRLRGAADARQEQGESTAEARPQRLDEVEAELEALTDGASRSCR